MNSLELISSRISQLEPSRASLTRRTTGTSCFLIRFAHNETMSLAARLRAAPSCFLRSVVGPFAKAIHPSASASGLFPLWLRAPRFISAALSSPMRRARRWLGAALVWGEEEILPPAPGSSSFLRSPPIAQPPFSFSFLCLSCRFRFLMPCLR